MHLFFEPNAFFLNYFPVDPNPPLPLEVLHKSSGLLTSLTIKGFNDELHT